MLATTKQVRTVINTLTDMTADGMYRRAWADKATDTTKRNMAFRFWDAKEADAVASGLQTALTAFGYTNKVKRTSVRSDYMSRTEGGEYVRVQAVFE